MRKLRNGIANALRILHCFPLFHQATWDDSFAAGLLLQSFEVVLWQPAELLTTVTVVITRLQKVNQGL